MENLNKTQKVIIAIIAVIMLLVIGYYIMHGTKQYNTFEATDAIQKNETVETSKIPDEQKTIIVHITGGVRTEGIIQLKEGDRIADAIDEAGGITDDADLSQVNLAYVLQDGQKIYIPRIQDQEIMKVVTDGSGDDVIIDGETNNNIVNINRANQTELETLIGIGPSTALKIIDYRKQNGEFKKKEELMNVPGIGESKFEAIKDNITI